MEVICLQNDTFLKSKCVNVTGLEIYKQLDINKYPRLHTFAANIACVFGSTYICEQFFSKLNYVKCKTRSRLTDEHLTAQLRIAVSDFEPDFETIAFSEMNIVENDVDNNRN